MKAYFPYNLILLKYLGIVKTDFVRRSRASARRRRRGGDSNSRSPCELNTLAGCCFQPLSHLSRLVEHVYHVNLCNMIDTSNIKFHMLNTIRMINMFTTVFLAYVPLSLAGFPDCPIPKLHSLRFRNFPLNFPPSAQ